MITAELQSLLQSGDAQQLDLLITLAEVPASCEEKISLWRSAFEVAHRWYLEYWTEGLSVAENLHKLDVCVEPLSPLNNLCYRARALYDPARAVIQISEEALSEMEAVQSALGVSLFTREQLRDRLLAHELFHHIEETKEAPLTDCLRKGEKPVPAAFRDVGAYAFCNGIFPYPICQKIDLLWMLEKAPKRLSENLRQIRL